MGNFLKAILVSECCDPSPGTLAAEQHQAWQGVEKCVEAEDRELPCMLAPRPLSLFELFTRRLCCFHHNNSNINPS